MNSLSNITLKLFLILIMLGLAGCGKKETCRKKHKSNYFIYNSPLIRELNPEINTQYNLTNNEDFVEILDSAKYYELFTEPQINFNNNSVINFNKFITSTKNRYINGFTFELAEQDNNYLLTINVCSYKTLINKKARLPNLSKTILTEKLKNKPIKAIVHSEK